MAPRKINWEKKWTVAQGEIAGLKQEVKRWQSEEIRKADCCFDGWEKARVLTEAITIAVKMLEQGLLRYDNAGCAQALPMLRDAAREHGVTKTLFKPGEYEREKR